MRRKSIILGLALFLGGTAVLGWSLVEKEKERRQMSSHKLKYYLKLDEYLKRYNEWLQLAPEERGELPWGLDEYGKTKPAVQLQQEQQERLLVDLDSLAAGETDAYAFADILYGENWRQELDKYKAREEMREFVLTGSILCVLTGGSFFTWWLLVGTRQLVIKVLPNLKKLATDWLRGHIKTKAKQPAGGEGKEYAETSEQEHKPRKQQIQLKKRSKVLGESGWHNCEGAPKQNKVDFEGVSAKNFESAPKSDRSTSGTQKAAVCRSDGSSVTSKEPLINETGCLNLNTMQVNENEPAQDVCETIKPDSKKGAVENSLKLEASFGAQTENLEKQMVEFKKMAHTVQQTAREHSEPIDNSLRELNQQMAAIREYASQQQDRVEKLQDGYDWNIVRTFCLRVIRCIDNLENRINQLSGGDVETMNLKEVRDELIFALESSGVEQFKPGINSDYRGQEKFAEVVKDKECSDEPNMAGKIAKVIRPGYQYVIDEENIKVVRTAQVKLFG
jgi:molecular chaperone GrpE (heat shock protein)